MKPILFLLTLLLSALLFEEKKGWRGIIPLHSTRADVERVLGASNDECKCLYKTEDAVVLVEYARGSCKDGLPGWNVPLGTVLSFTVRQKVSERFSNLNLDLSKFAVRQDDTLTKYYTDWNEGIEYEVSTAGVINSVTYVPSSSQGHLRCPGSSEDDKRTRYPPFNTYSDLSVNDEKDRLDVFAVQLHRNPNTTGYMVVYPGRRGSIGEAQARSTRAKHYLVNERNVEAGRIVTINGPRREKFKVELYVVPNGAPPPVACPNKTSLGAAGFGRRVSR